MYRVMQRLYKLAWFCFPRAPSGLGGLAGLGVQGLELEGRGSLLFFFFFGGGVNPKP